MWQRDEVPPLGREGALRELGFSVSRVSQTAYGKYAHQYEFTYNGVRVRVDAPVHDISI